MVTHQIKKRGSQVVYHHQYFLEGIYPSLNDK
jgi:hypothetical protein